jgi:hypothetical protein
MKKDGISSSEMIDRREEDAGDGGRNDEAEKE